MNPGALSYTITTPMDVIVLTACVIAAGIIVSYVAWRLLKKRRKSM